MDRSRVNEDYCKSCRVGCSCPYSSFIILHDVLTRPQKSLPLGSSLASASSKLVCSAGFLVGECVYQISSPRAFVWVVSCAAVSRVTLLEDQVDPRVPTVSKQCQANLSISH